jgi:hypothetical protein
MSSTSSFSGSPSRSSAQVRHLLRLSETLLDMSRFQPELQLTHISRKLFSEPLSLVAARHPDAEHYGVDCHRGTLLVHTGGRSRIC